jgi:hypothetical protein
LRAAWQSHDGIPWFKVDGRNGHEVQ